MIKTPMNNTFKKGQKSKQSSLSENSKVTALKMLTGDIDSQNEAKIFKERKARISNDELLSQMRSNPIPSLPFLVERDITPPKGKKMIGLKNPSKEGEKPFWSSPLTNLFQSEYSSRFSSSKSPVSQNRAKAYGKKHFFK